MSEDKDLILQQMKAMILQRKLTHNDRLEMLGELMGAVFLEHESFEPRPVIKQAIVCYEANNPYDWPGMLRWYGSEQKTDISERTRRRRWAREKWLENDWEIFHPRS
jgi:hypothetical protein